jgi:hypothetical protein
MKTCKTCGQELTKKVIQKIPAKTLIWGKISDKDMTWEDAKKWCELQGKEWDMPTRIELLQAHEAGIDFGSHYNFWSSTETYSGTTHAWSVALDYGNTNYANKTDSYYVRCVRR